MLASHLIERLDHVQAITVQGTVVKAIGLTLEGVGPRCWIGQSCRILKETGEFVVAAEVVGFRDDRILLMPLGEIRGIGAGNRIEFHSFPAHLAISPLCLGRVLDGLGKPIDGGAPFPWTIKYPIHGEGLNPLDRKRITRPLDVGVRAMNGLLTCGIGQKLGIFAGSGVGKSVLLGMLCRQTAADVNVIALIGERGREVKEFIDKELGPEGLKKSVVVAATSDQPPLVRLRGALVATALAEYFREQGKHVLLLMDSVTRLAHAQREIGLAVGEPPTTKGYPPSVFTMLPKLLERVGQVQEGSITGLYTVLVEGDDLTDPIADSVRSILDGHIVLSRSLAVQGHYPAIDVLQSVSRVMADMVAPDHAATARSLLELMSIYRNAEDLINLGAYQPGTNARLDLAIHMHEPMLRYLRQDKEEHSSYSDSVQGLEALLNQALEVERPRGVAQA